MHLLLTPLLVLWLAALGSAWGPSFLPATPATRNVYLQKPHSFRLTSRTILPAKTQEDDDDDDSNNIEKNMEDSLDKIDKIGEELLDLVGKVDASTPASSPKLGINIGSQLQPLTDQQAAELKAAAMEVINDGIAEGIDEIAKLRKDLNQAIDKQRAQNELKSELQLQKESSRLMKKIDQMTGSFLDETRAAREETKLVARADASTEGRGTELGVWGMIGGAAVVTKGTKHIGLLGSVEAAVQAAARQAKKERDSQMSDLKTSFGSSSSAEEEETATYQVNSNRVVIIADTSQDPLAKQLVPAFSEKLQAAIPTLEDIIILKPTDTIPLGGDNAVCAIVFCTSLSERTAVNRIMDRLLRRTMQAGGALGSPPTQLVGVTSIGTERTDKLPYSLQNLMGGKLDQRRQIEEAIMATVQNRVSSPPLDYTLCKFGDIKDSKEDFCMMPGDVLDGTTPLDTAANVLLQAVAYQPYARNATLCAVGSLPTASSEEELDVIWDDAFLRLDGPEVERWTTNDLGGPAQYDRLCEYLNEWANNFALNPRGLTTPIRVEPSKIKASSLTKRQGVRERSGVELLFLPTATGKNYLSREEERERESDGRSGKYTISRSRLAKEGGIEVVVEITSEDSLRVRAKRCNYAVGVPLKELSEETILKRLESAIDVWCKEEK